MKPCVATSNNNITDNTIFVGMDVHKSTFTLCAYALWMPEPEHVVNTSSDYHEVLKYIQRLKEEYGHDTNFVCGYEAGCLGYTLQRNLSKAGIDCKILAPTTMPKPAGGRIKTDSRDAMDIARNIAYRTCSFVHTPSEEDEQVKDYIRMRNFHKEMLKNTKRVILSFCLRHNIIYPNTKWTRVHLEWLRSLKLDGEYQEVFDEYLTSYETLAEKVSRLDKRITEIAQTERYAERVNKLRCLIGIRDYIALSTIVEVGDFSRFKKAGQFAAYIGIVPGEHSSGNKQQHLGITKKGNKLLRMLYSEAAQCYSRGRIGYKSKELKLKQAGQPPEFIRFADRANERIRKRYYRLTMRGKHGNVARTAVSRELACFIWATMTDNTGPHL